MTPENVVTYDRKVFRVDGSITFGVNRQCRICRAAQRKGRR